MPRTYSTQAIVLGSHKLGEADRIVTLFTSVYGKVPTVVKGVRKVKSRFGGRLEPFTYLNVQLYEGRNLHTLTAADTVRTHAALRESPLSLRAGLAFVEMLGRTTSNFEKRPRTFNLLERFLAELEKLCRNGANGRSITLLTLAAELKLLLLAGYLPHLSSCATCGREEVQTRFSAMAGGALCNDCAGESFTISFRALELMRLALENPLSSIGALDTGKSENEEIWQSIREICRYHLAIDLKVSPVNGSLPRNSGNHHMSL